MQSLTPAAQQVQLQPENHIPVIRRPVGAPRDNRPSGGNWALQPPVGGASRSAMTGGPRPSMHNSLFQLSATARAMLPGQSNRIQGPPVTDQVEMANPAPPAKLTRTERELAKLASFNNPGLKNQDLVIPAPAPVTPEAQNTSNSASRFVTREETFPAYVTRKALQLLP